MALQEIPVEEGVAVSIRVWPMPFASTVNVGPYHPRVLTTLKDFLDADVDDVSAT